MADSKISALPDASDIVGAVVPIVQGGTNKKAASTLFATNISGKADLVHAHAIADVTNLQTALDGKAASGHNHNGVYEPANANIQAHVASAHAPSTALGASVFTLAGDQATGANVTPVTLSGLVFSYATNSKYRIWFMGLVQPGAATTGCGFQFDLSDATGVSVSVQFFHQLASTGTLSGGHSIADDASVGVSSGMPATSTYPVTGFGLLISTTNSGTAQLRLRSETTAVTTAKAGFTLVVEKIA